MADYFRNAAQHRRAQPRGDVISHFVMLQQSGQITEDELIGSCILFLFAGHETTTNLIGNGIRALLENPVQKARLLADPTLIASAVEEMLRFEGPTGAVVRVVKTPFELRGRALNQGDRVYAMVNAANHDPSVFDSAGTFDIGRTPNRHRHVQPRYSLLSRRAARPGRGAHCCKPFLRALSRCGHGDGFCGIYGHADHARVREMTMVTG